MEWVDCKKQTPDGEYMFYVCLVADKKGCVQQALWNCKLGHFQAMSYEKLFDITHWMPLPEPPK